MQNYIINSIFNSQLSIFYYLCTKIYKKTIILKTIIRFFLLFMLSLNASAQSPKHEVRAVWLTTIGGIDWPRAHSAATQKQELTRTLDQLQRAGINTVLLQTRVRASVIYPSAIEPWDMCLTGRHGQSPGYDPLQFCIDECHRRGMELHAWVVTLPIGKLTEQRFKDFARKNPALVKRIGDSGYMNPEDARTGDYLARICTEITRNYDIDGIHLDYIRYPETWKMKVSRQQGRQYITNIVRKIHHAVKELKPWVKLSCSPIGKHDDLLRYRAGGWNAYTAVCQDAQGWMRQGLMDQLYPMQYFRDNHYFPFAIDWQEQSCGRTVSSGLGIYFLSPSEGKWLLSDVTRQLNACRQIGIGHCFFRTKFLTDNWKGIYDYVCRFNAVPALVPPMTWAAAKAPQAPANLQVSRTAKSDRLTWNGVESTPHLLYNIYASQDYPVDTDNPANLIAMRQTGTELTVPHSGKRLNYAVRATDRYGNESAAVGSQPEQQQFPKVLSPLDTSIPPFYYQNAKQKKKKKK